MPSKKDSSIPVGASLLAKNPRPPRLSRMHALSLAIFASKLAPTEGLQSSFFISPANAANGLCVALAIVGLLVEPSPKYCWSV
ncbi:hypothetical protein CEC48_05500 [Pseudomonas sp. K2I15]|nr:hypothetical protein CEC48_05500 [Pseudomonas sp. K2I15]